jgi:peptidoglycan/xylan/chitin deacetylase (PgdA/CDA1 family)
VRLSRRERWMGAACVAAALLLALLRLGFWSPLPRVAAEPVRRVDTEQRWVAITIDGSPSPRWTPAILRTLRRYGAPATFFPWGVGVERYPTLVRAMVAEGHEVGAAPLLPGRVAGLGPGALRREVWAASVRLEAVTGVRVQYFRPPDGGQVSALSRAAAADGEHLVLWDVDGGGRYGSPGPGAMAARVLRGVRRGAIIRLWQGTATAAALALLIPALAGQGYRPVSLARLIGAARVHVAGNLGFGPFAP